MNDDQHKEEGYNPDQAEFDYGDIEQMLIPDEPESSPEEYYSMQETTVDNAAGTDIQKEEIDQGPTQTEKTEVSTSSDLYEKNAEEEEDHNFDAPISDAIFDEDEHKEQMKLAEEMSQDLNNSPQKNDNEDNASVTYQGSDLLSQLIVSTLTAGRNISAWLDKKDIKHSLERKIELNEQLIAQQDEKMTALNQEFSTQCVERLELIEKEISQVESKDISALETRLEMNSEAIDVLDFNNEQSDRIIETMQSISEAAEKECSDQQDAEKAERMKEFSTKIKEMLEKILNKLNPDTEQAMAPSM